MFYFVCLNLKFPAYHFHSDSLSVENIRLKNMSKLV